MFATALTLRVTTKTKLMYGPATLEKRKIVKILVPHSSWSLGSLRLSIFKTKASIIFCFIPRPSKLDLTRLMHKICPVTRLIKLTRLTLAL